MKKFIYIFLLLFPFLSKGNNYVLNVSSSYTESEIISFINSCGCDSLIISQGAVIDMNGAWNLSTFDPLVVVISDSASLVFSGNGSNRDELTLSPNSFISITNTDNLNALVNDGGNGQVRINIGSSSYDGNDFVDIINGGGVDEGGVLPIELAYFKGYYDNFNSQVVLTFKTYQEFNNDYFTILRSSNRFDFQIVGYVEGSGNSLTERFYEYLDKTFEPGLNYYKLVQTDYDGTSYEESIIPVYVDKKVVTLYEIRDINGRFVSSVKSLDDLQLDNGFFIISSYDKSGLLIEQNKIIVR